MKTQMSILCLIAASSILSACHSNSSSDVGSSTSKMVKVSGNEHCLDAGAMFNDFDRLPGNQTVSSKITNIDFLSGSTSSDFEIEAVRSLYFSNIQPKSAQYDGSAVTQNGCDSLDITYKDGRVDHYVITAFTDEDLTMALQGNYPQTTTLRRINDQTLEMSYTTNFSICSGATNAGQGTVKITEVDSWSTPLTSFDASPALKALVQQTETAPALSCDTQSGS